MCAALIGGVALFTVSLALHVIVWRIRRPVSYRAWLPALAIIFGPVAAAIAWSMAASPRDLAAVLLLHGSLAAVYVIGYTLVSAFSGARNIGLNTLKRQLMLFEYERLESVRTNGITSSWRGTLMRAVIEASGSGISQKPIFVTMP